MYRLFIIFLFFISTSTFAQNNTKYALRLDSMRIQEFSLSKKGKLNLILDGKPRQDRIEVIIVRGMRPAATFEYNSLNDFNNSNITTEVMKLAQVGDGLMFGFTSPQGTTRSFLIDVIK